MLLTPDQKLFSAILDGYFSILANPLISYERLVAKNKNTWEV